MTDTPIDLDPETSMDPSIFITKKMIERLRNNLITLHMLLAESTEVFENLKAKKLDLSEYNTSIDNVYAINVHLINDIAAEYKANKSLRIDKIIQYHVDWLTSANSVLMLNLKHYNKNKHIRNHVNDLMYTTLPNAKSALNKGNTFLAQAEAFLGM